MISVSPVVEEEEEEEVTPVSGVVPHPDKSGHVLTTESETSLRSPALAAATF